MRVQEEKKKCKNKNEVTSCACQYKREESLHMRLYKGVLHGIIQGTSSRPVAAAAAAAVQIILHKARHPSCLFLIRCLKNIRQHLASSFPKCPWMCRGKTRLNFNCNPLEMCRPRTCSSNLSWALFCFFS